MNKNTDLVNYLAQKYRQNKQFCIDESRRGVCFSEHEPLRLFVFYCFNRIVMVYYGKMLLFIYQT